MDEFIKLVSKHIITWFLDVQRNSIVKKVQMKEYAFPLNLKSYKGHTDPHGLIIYSLYSNA
jgi:hypothetical protein